MSLYHSVHDRKHASMHLQWVISAGFNSIEWPPDHTCKFAISWSQ